MTLPLPPPRRAAGPDWPRVLTPAAGCLPPIATPRPDERILCVPWTLAGCADRTSHAYLQALEGCGAAYREVPVGTEFFDVALLEAAEAIRPTLVFLNLQGPSIGADFISELRPLCDPACVIVQWDGDQHHEPSDPRRQWFVDLGRVLDASLVVNVKHPAEYAALGVRHPGFLGCGVDENVWRPTVPAAGVPPVVTLANNWPQFDYAARNRTFAAVAAAFPDEFAVYGGGWESGAPFPTRPFLRNEDQAGVYAAARAVLSMSIRCDLPRYTSHRLFGALAAGAVTLVEWFPDCEGLGLVDGYNCILWHGIDELLDKLRHLPARPLEMRMAARRVGMLHGLGAWLGELMAVVDAVRRDR